ncbi:bifunctional [glutamine synthetase] adenylyltransferase/[glutamine synthetase]-adenylyl-L-tyrosine phosphorylase [Solicola gregarius]|uniref:Bifunctional glutamine synthetase adenylyltransferase/adenylyl-removing enzyme n=1 Tax=Solicola gregarius TaxID=2908642 RepID=A0AA46YLG3_9ACTN|nr:bifunctional [glutamine synthetase] adenylyltransferase/[glutamine synthetase]-adenylyl-L-tyrosine phosphorylase [Solicola gregarius]UYM05564.1 bifunctional [glutamine synthetase] adenylyltransferase/[glutamine synthetase]-adenylyl-L-tyrosine phosphorylase [Solicola gregarius]
MTTTTHGLTAGRLSRLGFQAPADALAQLDLLGDQVTEELVIEWSRAADPDLALASLVGIAERSADDPVAALAADADLNARLTAVLGTSRALGEFLNHHPEQRSALTDEHFTESFVSHGQLRTALLTATGTDPGSDLVVSAMDTTAAIDALRVEYHRLLLQIAARDLIGTTRFEESSGELADLAAATLSAALAIARGALGDDRDACTIAVIALGKCGGGELNYISDVDVVFVYEPTDGTDDETALRAASRIAAMMMQICSQHTGEGTIWEVDAALRPEGKAGPLVRTLQSHVTYYERWASTWEFQALLKARPVAGDDDLGQAYVDAILPMVWQASTRDHFVRDVRAMRRRVIDHIPPDLIERELKLGPGGLRDVEFAVQLLQLVHGRSDQSLRSGNTLSALYALIQGGYVGREDGAAFAEAYIFLRLLEHRVQLYGLRRTHMMPADEVDLRRIGRSLELRQNPVSDVRRIWRANTREVQRLHQKIFYRPLLETVAALPREGLRLTPDAAEQRLVALGYDDPKGALAHLQALTRGVSRRAAIQRQLLPAMLAWFAEAPDPDAGLLAFRKVSDALGTTPWYLRKLRDEGEGAEQLATILASSTYVTGLILRAPEAVALLGETDDLVPRSVERLRKEMDTAARRYADPADAIRSIRRLRRKELSRVGIADVLGRLDIEAVGTALTAITTATLSAALNACVAAAESGHGGPLPTRIAIIAMGRLGGGETGYGSDADVMFVHDPDPDADPTRAHELATGVIQRVRDLLSSPGDDPGVGLDADLRPEGRQGPLLRTLASYRAYYDRWSAVWEAQALLRASVTIGDERLCADFRALIDPLRWPDGGISDDAVSEVRRIKARVDSERLPRGADPALHLKLGRGGLADVEWTVQLMQMQHAYRVDGLRTPQTLPALYAARDAGLIDAADADALEAAWRLASRARNAIVLVRSKASDSLPTHADDRAGVAFMLGYGDESEPMIDDYRRVTRHARAVVERIFWG